ncbi:hypothetical protein N431DRAFT_428373 [Stipitochalara longipes BDJ]|nr:hypothetical protein N431DRAFT_428373 [Stipitochalara longipes BDJ]
MTKRIHRRVAVVPQLTESVSTTPRSSAYPSACPFEAEDEDIATLGGGSFPFLSLPSELRNKIYSLVFSAAPLHVDLDPSIFRIFHRTQMFAIFRVSHQLYREATHHFFSTHTFRIFPICPGRYFETKRPLLARLPARYRETITSLELRLGPGWNNPPRGWVVNEALGLADCTSVRVLKVFVEFDPSDAIFKGFRKSDGFYEEFSASLLDEIMKRVPSIKVVEFDAYTSIKRSGGMMLGLERVAAKYEGKVIGWGPERGWEREVEQVWLDAILIHAATTQRLSRTRAILA